MSNTRGLFERARQALGTTQAGLGAMLGVTRRTAQRWTVRGIPSSYLPELARAVHPRDPQLAREVAAAMATTLEELGLEAPARPALAPAAMAAAAIAAAPPPEAVVDAVVCAAAEAMDLTPRAVRPGLHAAFARAQEIGLTLDVSSEHSGRRRGRASQGASAPSFSDLPTTLSVAMQNGTRCENPVADDLQQHVTTKKAGVHGPQATFIGSVGLPQRQPILAIACARATPSGSVL